MTMNDPKAGVTPTPPGPSQTVRWGLLCAGGGFAAVFVILRLAILTNQTVSIWPVSGIILGLLLPFASQYPSKKLVLYLSGVAGVFAGGIAVGVDYRLAAIRAALVAIDLFLIGALLIPKISKFDDLKQRENVLRLVATTIFSSTLTAALGAFPLSRLLKLSMFNVAIGSASADAIGICLAFPFILLLRTLSEPRASKPVHRGLRPFLFSAPFLLVAITVFWQNKGPYLFTIFPPMILMLFETGLEGAVLGALALSVIGWFATLHGHGPMWLVRDVSVEARLVALRFFIWVSVVTAMPVGAALDERKKAERNSRNAESIHRLLLQYSSEVIVLSALDGTHRHVSPCIETLTGWTPEEYSSQNRVLTIHPQDRSRVKSMFTGVAVGTVNRFRYRLLRKDGGSRWVDATVYPYGDKAVDGYVKTIRDISDFVESEEHWKSERRRLAEEQERLTEAEQATQLQLKLRDEFLSNVSHELRSPLTSIYSFTTIIDDGLAGQTTPEQKEYLAIILKNIRQLQSMIEDLLTVTQTEEGKLSIRIRPVPISEAVADTIRNLESTAKAKKIALSWTAHRDLPQVLADPVRLRQILTILIDNALKFTPENGTVDVFLSESPAGFVRTQIRDTGCGIPRDKWTKIFDKLYQITHTSHSDTSNAGRSGLGLGLHIARTLITGQGGQIWVTSVPGVGSVFHFTLPVFRERRSEAITHEPAALAESPS